MILTTPILFAFVAGMVATVNPCGFAMLPAYVSMFLGEDDDSGASPGAWAGLRVGAAVTAGFLALFGVVGVLVSVGLWGILAYVPWIALIIGAGLFILGIAVLRGFHLTARVISVKTSNRRSFLGMAGFGVAFGAASISCTLPIFLAVVGLSARSSNVISGWSVFVAYAAGMGVVLTAMAVALVTSRRMIVTRMRRILPYVERIGGWLLVTSGLFIVYYWGVQLTVNPGQGSILYRPISFVGGISAWFTNSIGNAADTWAIGFATVILVAGIAPIIWSRRRRTKESAA